MGCFLSKCRMEAGLDGFPAQVAEGGGFQVQDLPGKLIETSQKVKKKV